MSTHNQKERPAVWWSQQAPQAQACRHGPSTCGVVRRLGPPHAPELASALHLHVYDHAGVFHRSCSSFDSRRLPRHLRRHRRPAGRPRIRQSSRQRTWRGCSECQHKCMHAARSRGCAVLCCPVLTAVLYSTCAGPRLTLLPCAAHRQPRCGTAHNNICSCQALPSMLACACADLAPAGLAAR